MKKLEFTIAIAAPREKVWTVLWDDTTYREWVGVFSEGSYAETDWQEGSPVRFLGPGGEGMFSEIARKIPNEFMSFRHLGVVKDFKNLTADEQTEKWSGSMENYYLTGTDGSTDLKVEIDVIEDYEEYFSDTFPKALEVVKKLSET